MKKENIDFVSEYDMKLAAAFYVLGKLISADLPGIAENALSQGADTPSLRILAGEQNPIMAEVGPLFEKCLSEMNVPKPDKDAAAFEVSRFYARKIVRKELTPYIGARAIWWKVANEVKKRSILRHFIGAASEIEEFPMRTREDGIDRRQLRIDEELKIISLADELLKMEKPGQMFET